MFTYYRVAAVACAAFAISGCDDSLRSELTIATDASEYSRSSPEAGPSVGISIRNISSRDIHLGACAGTDLLPLRERFLDGTWVVAPVATCVTTFQARVISPGETVYLGWWNFLGATGTFRLRAPIYRDSLGVAPSRDVSLSFTVR
jgi:hypothetical protein